MNFHKKTEDTLEPCKHMEPMLNRTAEGSAPKLMELYARAHARRCPNCGPFLTRLTTLLQNLRGIKSHPTEEESLPQEDWQSLESRWSEVEATHSQK